MPKIHWIKIQTKTSDDMMQIVTDNFGGLILDSEWLVLDKKISELIREQVLISQERVE